MSAPEKPDVQPPADEPDDHAGELGELAELGSVMRDPKGTARPPSTAPQPAKP